MRLSDWSSDVCSSDLVLKHWEKHATLNTDKATSYGAAITELKREGKLDWETAHRQVKYLNTVIEADHGKRKILIKQVSGCNSITTAYAPAKRVERSDERRDGKGGDRTSRYRGGQQHEKN